MSAKQSEDFQKLLTTEVFSDIALKIDDEVIQAHKNILVIRSPVFLDLIMKNPSIDELEITEIKYEVMKIVLFFMYTGKFPEFDSNTVCDVLIASNKYELFDLKSNCEENIIKSLKIDNVIKYLIFSLTCDSTAIKKQATEFLIDNFIHFRGPDFQKIQDIDPKLLIEILDRSTKKLSAPIINQQISTDDKFAIARNSTKPETKLRYVATPIPGLRK